MNHQDFILITFIMENSPLQPDLRKDRALCFYLNNSAVCCFPLCECFLLPCEWPLLQLLLGMINYSCVFKIISDLDRMTQYLSHCGQRIHYSYGNITFLLVTYVLQFQAKLNILSVYSYTLGTFGRFDAFSIVALTVEVIHTLS